jgi:predicted RNase H-like nuclease
MHLVGGADGCRGGWFLATKDLMSGRISFQIYPTAYELFYKTPSLDVLALDIPIGLKERGPRKCDLLARRLLKAGRASSVFPAPVRPVLSSNTYQQACQTRFEIEGKRMSLQAWALVEKIRTVDAILRTDTPIRDKTSEVHPEVSFL